MTENDQCSLALNETGIDGKGIWAKAEGDRNVLYFDCGGNHADIITCQNSNCTFNVGPFYCM